MKKTQTLIADSGEVYNSSDLKWSFDGLNNQNSYLLDIGLETYAPEGGHGMIIDNSYSFSVGYPQLRVLTKPILTELKNKSAEQIDWTNICQNPGVISGIYEYIENFILYGNTALNLEKGATLTYNTSTIPANSLFCFTTKLQKDFDGLLCWTLDNKYKIGYELSTQRFYTIINGMKNYNTEQTKITENPFIIFVLESHIVIKQYNIYNEVKNCIDFKVSDICDYPVAFMVQENN